MGGQSSKEVAGKPVVVVCGGGYGGTKVAKELDNNGDFNVVLIDRKDYFLHNIAAVRAAVDPSWVEKITIPYAKLLKYGTVVHAEIDDINPNGVLVHGHPDRIKFDYLVIATGSSYAIPAKVAESTQSEAVMKYREFQSTLNESNKILIVGGGPVGCELAAEIKHYNPTKQVTIVHSHQELIGEGFKEAFYTKLSQNLQRLGVEVILGEKVQLDDKQNLDLQNSPQLYLKGRQWVSITSGRQLDVDLIVFATGISINNGSFGGLGSQSLDETGKLKVNRFLQLEGHTNIFALGDCANVPERKMAYFAGKQADCVASNISAITKNKSLHEYKPTPGQIMFVSLGPNLGVGQLPGNMVAGNTLVPAMKSKKLFVEDNWKQLNQHIGHAETVSTSTSKSLAAAMNITEEEANKIRRDLVKPDHHDGTRHT